MCIRDRFSRDDATYAYSPHHASLGTVEPGEVFETTAKVGKALLEQVGNYELVDEVPK